MMNNDNNSNNRFASIFLNGIYPPLPTPFNEKGEIDPSKLVRNIDFLNRFNLRGYVLLGSNGESVMLTNGEKIALTHTVRSILPPGKLLIVGTGCQSTLETIMLNQEIYKVGADVALVITPSFYKAQMTNEALINHYMTIADESPIPILIYNMPANTGIDMDAETICAVAQHPNVIGIKDSSGNVAKLGAIRNTMGTGFQVLAGSAGFLLPALSVGAVGGIMALANIAPGECIEIQRLFSEGKIKDAQNIQVNLIPLNTAVTSKWGVAALKTAMDNIGLYGGPVRGPLLPLSSDQKKILNSIINMTGLKKV
jgi:4-hydroxy-2-oxoglutarate aldolase